MIIRDKTDKNVGIYRSGESSEEEQKEFMEKIYPVNLDNYNENKWRNLVRYTADRFLSSYDSD